MSRNITRRAFVAAAFATVTALAAPKEAQAIPRQFRQCPRVKQNGITYLLYQRAAIVTAMPNRQSVTIPDTIRHASRVYTVSAIWDGTASRAPRISRLVIRARSLESIEDPAIWDRRGLTVILSDFATYAWLVSAKHASRIVYRG